jgi:hypothetical protein
VFFYLKRYLDLDIPITLISQVACTCSVSANEISAWFKSGKAKFETSSASTQLLYECWVTFKIQQGFQQIYAM